MAGGMVSAQSKAPAQPILRIEAGTHVAPATGFAGDELGRWVVTGSEDKTARIWDTATGRQVRILRPPIGPGEEGKITSVAMSGDGKLVVLATTVPGAQNNNTQLLLFQADGRQVRRVHTLTALSSSYPEIRLNRDAEIRPSAHGGLVVPG